MIASQPPPASSPALLEQLFELQRTRGIRPGLTHLGRSLRRLGSPQLAVPAVHVVGTKGKGSTAAMLHSMLCAAGYRAALYTSPHLLHPRERLRIGDRQPTDDELLGLFGEVEAASGGSGSELTFFEIMTAMAFLWFRQEGAEVAVLEAGMGGRLDATRLAGGSLVLVTRLALDHQEYLGTTLGAIAGEKAAIARRGATVITAEQSGEALAALGSAAGRGGWRLLEAGALLQTTIHGTDAGGVTMTITGAGRRLSRLTCPLPGRHQAGNASLAVLGALALEDRGFTVSDRQLAAGLGLCRWPGRNDLRGIDPPVLLDGAHNPAGMEALVAYLREVFPGERPRMVLAMMKDKDVAGTLRLLCALQPRLRVAACATPRSLPAGELAGMASEAGMTVEGAHRDVADALEAWRGEGRELVVVTGSLFAVAEALAAIERRPPPPLGLQ